MQNIMEESAITSSFFYNLYSLPISVRGLG